MTTRSTLHHVVCWMSCALVAPACASAPRPASPTRTTWVDDGTPYDALRQRSVHNAYDKEISLSEQLREQRFRSVEIDLHRGKLGRAAQLRDWWVYHVAVPGLDGSSCETLTDCLGEIDAFHRDVPQHDVLTLFLDVKDDLDEPGHGVTDLDARIRAALPRHALVEPASLRDRCPVAPTLRASVAGPCGWPSLGELRGKIFVVLTGGDLCHAGSPLVTYLREPRGERAAFVAPRVHDGCGFEGQARSGATVFFNLDAGSFHVARAIARAHLVSRGFAGGLEGGIDAPDEWARALDAGVNVLATDHVDGARAPWTQVLTPVAPRAHDVASTTP